MSNFEGSFCFWMCCVDWFIDQICKYQVFVKQIAILTEVIVWAYIWEIVSEYIKKELSKCYWIKMFYCKNMDPNFSLVFWHTECENFCIKGRTFAIFYSFSQQIFIDCLLYTSQYLRGLLYWQWENRQRFRPQRTYILIQGAWQYTM